ncbi:MAG: hypothetical protein H0V12_11265, partial [Chloroflexi bacterium]|nr:hypothetical protein [Chloroflexota bacterium]
MDQPHATIRADQLRPDDVLADGGTITHRHDPEGLVVVEVDHRWEVHWLP